MTLFKRSFLEPWNCVDNRVEEKLWPENGRTFFILSFDTLNKTFHRAHANLWRDTFFEFLKKQWNLTNLQEVGKMIFNSNHIALRRYFVGLRPKNPYQFYHQYGSIYWRERLDTKKWLFTSFFSQKKNNRIILKVF